MAAAIHPAEQQDPFSGLGPTPGIGLQGLSGRLPFQRQQRVIRGEVKPKSPRPTGRPMEARDLNTGPASDVSANPTSSFAPGFTSTTSRYAPASTSPTCRFTRGSTCRFTRVGYAQYHFVEKLARVFDGQVVSGGHTHHLAIRQGQQKGASG